MVFPNLSDESILSIQYAYDAYGSYDGFGVPYRQVCLSLAKLGFVSASPRKSTHDDEKIDVFKHEDLVGVKAFVGHLFFELSLSVDPEDLGKKYPPIPPCEWGPIRGRMKDDIAYYFSPFNLPLAEHTLPFFPFPFLFFLY